jgi:hypothetical protein
LSPGSVNSGALLQPVAFDAAFGQRPLSGQPLAPRRRLPVERRPRQPRHVFGADGKGRRHPPLLVYEVGHRCPETVEGLHLGVGLQQDRAVQAVPLGHRAIGAGVAPTDQDQGDILVAQLILQTSQLGRHLLTEAAGKTPLHQQQPAASEVLDVDHATGEIRQAEGRDDGADRQSLRLGEPIIPGAELRFQRLEPKQQSALLTKDLVHQQPRAEQPQHQERD